MDAWFHAKAQRRKGLFSDPALREIQQFSTEQGQDFLGGLGGFARNPFQTRSASRFSARRGSGMCASGLPRLRDCRPNPAWYNGRLFKPN
jgi:hypothetical protein